jgi:probable rRNA maturation factor
MSEDPSSCSPENPPRGPDPFEYSNEAAARAAVIDVGVDAAGWNDALSEVEDLCRAAALAALRMSGRALPAEAAPEVSIVLADDDALRRLNRDYRGKDRPTNVLSFSALEGAATPDCSGGPMILGDVVVALETAEREAAAEGKSLADHLRHLVVHGVLHLLGYDHEAPAEAEEMEDLERRVLAGMGVSDPYAARQDEDAAEASA